MASSLFRRKSVDHVLAEAESGGGTKLARSLSAFDLTMIGVGAIIGAGIFARIGSASFAAGPAVILSFVLSGVACICAGLCYAEMAAMLPVAGSAYTYAYATLGEIFAWTIGWALVLEYAVGAITVAIAWSSYLVKLLEKGFHIYLPGAWCNGYLASWTDAAGVVHAHGILNVPAVILVLGVTWLLITGVKESARVASTIVFIKIAAVLLVIGLGARFIDTAHWSPFMPNGWSGIIKGAGVIFFAYIGFDAVTTMSEEAKNPQRDLPIGIIGSLLLCTFLYIVLAATLTGIVPITVLKEAAPVAAALASVGVGWGVTLVSFAALAGLGSVVVVMMMGQPRVFLAMSRDGLLPSGLNRIHPKYMTPHRATLITGSIVAISASTLSEDIAGNLTSMGTLFAFVLVCVGVVLLRRADPARPRPFRVPMLPAVALLGILACLVMMGGLDPVTQINFLIWLAIGLVVYFTYGKRHSFLQKRAEAQ